MPITINGTTGISGVNGSAGTPALQGNDTNTGISFGTDVILGSTNGIERFRVDSSGQVGIGTSSPASLLNVSGSSLGLALQVTDTSATSGVGQKISNTTNTLNFGINNSSGNAFNGGGAYGAVFDMTGAYAMAFCTNATERMRIRADGQIVCVATYDNTTANAANVHIFTDKSLGRSTSSIRYKQNVEDLQDSYADAILNCRPVWYQSKCTNDNPDWGYWGFIAEEVEQVDPRLCHYGADENGDQVVESVQYDRFVPHLLNLIKRQGEAIADLQAEVAALKAQ